MEGTARVRGPPSSLFRTISSTMTYCGEVEGEAAAAIFDGDWVRVQVPADGCSPSLMAVNRNVVKGGGSWCRGPGRANLSCLRDTGRGGCRTGRTGDGDGDPCVEGPALVEEGGVDAKGGVVLQGIAQVTAVSVMMRRYVEEFFLIFV